MKYRSLATTKKAVNSKVAIKQRLRKRFLMDSSRITSDWSFGVGDCTADQLVNENLHGLRSASRKLFSDNEYMKRFIQIVVDNVAGPNGQVFKSKAIDRSYQEDKVAQAAIEQTFAEWCRAENCDFRGQSCFSEMQRQVVQARSVDGESFVRIHAVGQFGIQLEVIDSIYVDHKYNDDLSNGGFIRFGIEYEKSGKVAAYYLTMPMFNAPGSLYGNVVSTATNRERIPASEIIHVFNPERVGQRRGFPLGSNAFKTLKMVDDYDEQAIAAAKNGAAMSLYAKVEEGKEVGLAYNEEGDPIEREIFSETDEITMLPSGVDLVNPNPAYPAGEYVPFMNKQLARIAVGFGINYASLTSDLSNVNYSSMKLGRAPDLDMFLAMQTWFSSRFLDIVFRVWIERQFVLQTIKISGRPLNREVDLYRRHIWQGRRWESLDPTKDANAKKMALENNLMSRSQIIRERGDDPTEVFEEIASERESFEELGLTPSMEPTEPETSEATAEETPPEEESPPGDDSTETKPTERSVFLCPEDDQ